MVHPGPGCSELNVDADRNGKAPRPLALVTGASSGIGAALARELARDGYDLVLVARREAPMRALADELAQFGAKSTVIAANLSVFDAACRLVAHLEARGLADIDVLISNAGRGDYASFLEAEPTRLSEMMRLNVAASTELIRALLPGMVPRARGGVLLVAALAGFTPGPNAAVYHATNAYLLRLGEALAFELRGSGLTATTLAAGATRTEFAAAARGESTRLFAGDVMQASDVARVAYRALKNGRRVCVPGMLNKLRVVLARYSPRALLLPTVAWRNARADEA